MAVSSFGIATFLRTAACLPSLLSFHSLPPKCRPPHGLDVCSLHVCLVSWSCKRLLFVFWRSQPFLRGNPWVACRNSYMNPRFASHVPAFRLGVELGRSQAENVKPRIQSSRKTIFLFPKQTHSTFRTYTPVKRHRAVAFFRGPPNWFPWFPFKTHQKRGYLKKDEPRGRA